MELTKKYADQLDKEDVLSSFRKKFIIPEQDGEQRTYFLGNSLGLQPKTTAHAIDYILHQMKYLIIVVCRFEFDTICSEN